MPDAKKYYKIGEVCQLTGVQAHLLRYWEREIRSIRPDRSLKNQRLYSAAVLERIRKVKELVDAGYRLDSVSRHLAENAAESHEPLLLEIKNDLQKLKSLLEY